MTPMTNSNAEVLGHLAVMDTKPLPLDQFDLSVFKMLELRRKDNGLPLWIQWWARSTTVG